MPWKIFVVHYRNFPIKSSFKSLQKLSWLIPPSPSSPIKKWKYLILFPVSVLQQFVNMMHSKKKKFWNKRYSSSNERFIRNFSITHNSCLLFLFQKPCQFMHLFEEFDFTTFSSKGLLSNDWFLICEHLLTRCSCRCCCFHSTPLCTFSQTCGRLQHVALSKSLFKSTLGKKFKFSFLLS